MNQITINSVRYNIVDAIEKITMADSFVVRSNKIGKGNGESKLYVGNENDFVRNFFGGKGFQINCIMFKKDILRYLTDIQEECLYPEQDYKDKYIMFDLWNQWVEKVKELQDLMFFNLSEQTQILPPRIYTKSNSEYYKLIRELSLPNITYLSIIKLVSVDALQVLFYFRLFVDGAVEKNNSVAAIEREIQRIEETQTLEPLEKLQLVKARIGQGRYRENLLKECPLCPITLIEDDKLLIASHIKPWVESNNKEKLDPKNGFVFTPTFDLLFDRGFISFTDDKEMLVCPWLSKSTLAKLNIENLKYYPELPIEGREVYLEYHRKEIFKG